MFVGSLNVASLTNVRGKMIKKQETNCETNYPYTRGHGCCAIRSAASIRFTRGRNVDLQFLGKKKNYFLFKTSLNVVVTFESYIAIQ